MPGDVPKPLAGISVLEAANFISGPYAAMLLADLGATVIKVELPGAGDPLRHWRELEGRMRPQFAAYNRGKQSITLNLKTEDGREIFRRIAATADVVIENFRAGVLDSLDVGYEALRELNPRIIYCSITGMGSSGPDRERPTYDATAQAMSGLWSTITPPSDPKAIGPALSDQLTGLFAAQGVLAALVERGEHGPGRKLEVSMLSASMSFLTEPIADYLMAGRIVEPHQRGQRAQSYGFVAADGLPFAVHLSTLPKFWQGLVEVVDAPELLDDPRFARHPGRVKHFEELHAILSERFRRRPRHEWIALLEAKDVPVAPINNIAEAVESAPAQQLQMVQTYGAGERAVRLVRPPLDFDGQPLKGGGPPPELGEHTDAILELLGYDADTRHALHERGVI